LARRSLASTGTVQFELSDEVAGRQYVLPEGTILVATLPPVAGVVPPAQTFGTTATVILSHESKRATVGVVAFEPGPAGDVAKNLINAIDFTYRSIFLADFGTAKVTVTNPAPTTGGTGRESDPGYRNRLIGLARNLWTVEAVTQAALAVPGAVDVLLSDPLGG